MTTTRVVRKPYKYRDYGEAGVMIAFYRGNKLHIEQLNIVEAIELHRHLGDFIREESRR